jgi:hypothetical protein
MKKLFDQYDLCYFDADAVGKRSYLSDFVDPSAISLGRKAVDELIDSLDLSDFSASFCLRVFQSVGGLWFLLPTSTGGKYHGGVLSVENCIGGNIVHTKNVVGMVPKVLNRYRELCNNTGQEYLCFREVLTCACLLHDIGKSGLKGDEVYSCSDHGEIGASIISDCWSKGDYKSSCSFNFFIDSLLFAVQEHMYMWRGINYLDRVLVDGKISASVIISMMLCECDYFSF